MRGRPCIMNKIDLSDNEAFTGEDQDGKTVIFEESVE
jgi:hypothetical protein